MKRLVLIASSLLLFSCSAGYKLAKTASEYELKGDFETAAFYYRKSLDEDRDRLKSKIGLERNGKLLIERYIKEFNQYLKDKRLVNAYSKYDEIEDYAGLLRRYDVNYSIPQDVQQSYEELCKSLAEIEYSRGIRYLNNEDYDKAKQSFQKVQQYVRYYKDTGNLISICNQKKKLYDAESNYIMGVQQLENGEYESAIRYLERAISNVSNYKDSNDLLARTRSAFNLQEAEEYYQSGINKMSMGYYKDAYHAFEYCLRYKNPYKDASELKLESFNLAQLTVGIFPFTNNSSRNTSAHSILYSRVLSDIVNMNDQFIKVYDRNNLQRLLSEHNLYAGGYIDPNYAIRNGKMLGLKYIITGSVVNLIENTQQPMRNILNVYGVNWNYDANGNLIPYGVPIRIGHVTASTELTIDFQIQIIYVETGQILDSRIFSDRVTDNIEYFETDVDPRGLSWNDPALTVFYIFGIPTYRIDRIDPQMFQKRRNLRSVSDLEGELVSKIDDQISSYLKQYLRNALK